MLQNHNVVGGNLAGRDVNVTNLNSAPETFMCRLRVKFEEERANSAEFRSVIDALQFYREPIDAVPIGLQRKLELGGRQADLRTALRAKELFVKRMTRYSLSEAAQEVFAFCLGQINQLFKARVAPLIMEGAPHAVVDTALVEQVIQPLLDQLEANFLGLMPQEVEGMVYYLTANCFLDWHIKGL